MEKIEKHKTWMKEESDIKRVRVGAEMLSKAYTLN